MAFFPQLESGSLVQYPYVKRIEARSVVNDLPDGTRIRLFDGGAVCAYWDLSFSGLTAGERVALEMFFESMEGRLQEFTWLDPMSNLLAWSEDLEAACWSNGPLLECAVGGADPLGGVAATHVVNSAQSMQSIEQSVASPAGYTYAFSIWARGDVEGEIALAARASGSSSKASRRISPVWSRLSHTFNLGGTEDSATFAVELPSGSAVDLFGAQVEPQPQAGAYKRTGGTGGIHPRSRFDQDALSFEAEAPGSYGTTIRIRSAIQG
jgi:hypothetical protein